VKLMRPAFDAPYTTFGSREPATLGRRAADRAAHGHGPCAEGAEPPCAV